MRRAFVLVPFVVVAVLAAGCTSGSTTKRTVTVVSTQTGSSPVVSVPRTTGSLVVVSPSGSAGQTTAKTTPATTTTSSAAAIVKVDPLKADCAGILDAADVKKAIGATISSKTNRIRLNAAKNGVTGAIRCLYGSTDGGKTAPVRIRLTQYGTAAAAKTQVGIDVQAAQDAGAAVTTRTVNGYPASLQLIAGGVLEMQYDTWTLALAVSDKQATNALLTSGLPVLAGQALVRILKGN